MASSTTTSTIYDEPATANEREPRKLQLAETQEPERPSPPPDSTSIESSLVRPLGRLSRRAPEGRGRVSRGEATGLDVPRGVEVGSKMEILWFSVVHQAALLACGLGCAAVLGTRWWATMSCYAMVGLGMWLTHWAGHRQIVPGWFEFHTIGHHVKSYPPARFLTERYVSLTGMQKGRQNTRWMIDLNVKMYAPWIPLTAAIHWAVTGGSLADALLALVVGAVLIVENEIIHEQVHVRGSSFERFRWFQVMRGLHYLHHKEGMHHNYSMCDFTFDLLSGNLINMY